MAEYLGDTTLVTQLTELAARWCNAFDPELGLLKDSTFYEGSRHNYAFRLTHDMPGRIALGGCPERYIEQLDTFFGYGAESVQQLSQAPSAAEVLAGYNLGRFEGLNNEPDMDVPWAYHYLGQPDRTAEIVHNVLHQQFGTGRGGLPGNDDSGALSSWFVWASLGVQAAEFNGEPLIRTWLRATELHRGGELVIELGPRPGDWGTVELPSQANLAPTRPPSPENQP